MSELFFLLLLFGLYVRVVVRLWSQVGGWMLRYEVFALARVEEVGFMWSSCFLCVWQCWLPLLCWAVVCVAPILCLSARRFWLSVLLFIFSFVCRFICSYILSIYSSSDLLMCSIYFHVPLSIYLLVSHLVLFPCVYLLVCFSIPSLCSSARLSIHSILPSISSTACSIAVLSCRSFACKHGTITISLLRL